MKKIIYIYIFSVLSGLFTYETNASDPFNVKPWEVDPEEETQKAQDTTNTDGNTSAEDNLHE